MLNLKLQIHKIHADHEVHMPFFYERCSFEDSVRVVTTFLEPNQTHSELKNQNDYRWIAEWSVPDATTQGRNRRQSKALFYPKTGLTIIQKKARAS